MSKIIKNGIAYAGSNNTDNKVSQVPADSSDTQEYPILLAGTADEVARTEGVKKATGLSYKPNGGWVYTDHAQVWSQLLVGSSNNRCELSQGIVYASNEVVIQVAGGYIRLPHRYSTDEQIVGCWLDGRLIYEKTVVLSSAKSLSPNANTTIMTWSEAIYPISFKGYRTSSNPIAWEGISASYQNGNLVGVSSRDTAISLESFTIQYYKST